MNYHKKLKFKNNEDQELFINNFFKNIVYDENKNSIILN